MSFTHYAVIDDQPSTELEQVPSGAREALPLPIELRTEILKYLLIASSFLIFHHPSLRKGDSSASEDMPFLSDGEIARQFSILCQVSQQTRQDARIVFFEHNQWNLEISINKPFSFSGPGAITTWMNPAQHISAM